MKISKPIINVNADLGEGAIWDANTKLFYWVDINDDKIFCYDPSTNINTAFEIEDCPSTIVPRESGGVIVTVKNGFASYDFRTKEFEMIRSVEQNIDNTRFNDGKCDPAGRLWAGTMELSLDGSIGSLYALDTDHSVRKLLSNVGCSNGIVWSADSSTMYYIDSLRQAVHAYDYDIESGAINNERVAVTFDIEEGIPDGMTIDSEGMVWIAIFGGSKVCRYNPQSGEKLDTVEVPGARCVTSCALGGENLKDLFITTAKASYIYKNDTPENHTHGGCCFAAKVDVPGIPAVSFKG